MLPRHLEEVAAAESLANEEKWGDAAVEYERKAEQDPSNLHAWFSAGEAWGQAGEYERAMSAYERVVEIPAFSHSAALAIARAAGVTGDAPGAAEALQRATSAGFVPLTELEDSAYSRVRDTPELQLVLDSLLLRQYPARDVTPSWSPNGEDIVFASNWSPDSRQPRQDLDLFTINVESGYERRLTIGLESDSYPTWSPDGRQIVFARVDSEESTLMSIELDDREAPPKLLLRGKNLGIFGVDMPTYFPDGSSVALVASVDGAPQIFTVRTDGSDLRQITVDSRYKGDPTVTPDGRICYDLAIGRDQKFSHQKLNPIECAFLSEPSQPVRILDRYIWWHPRWSADGGVLVAALWFSHQDRFGRLAVIDEQSGAYQLISPPEMDVYYPVVSPDGAAVVFSGSNVPYGSERYLYEIDLDGSDLRRLRG